MKKITLLLSLLFALSGCSYPTALPTSTSPPPTAILTRTPTFTPSPLPTFTEAATATATPTATPTIIPTYAVLRGEVLERANCRYGPGAPYLYKYGLVKGSNLEVIGRLDDASWVQIQAIGGDNPCWVKASLMDIKGNPFSIEPVYPDKAPLPVSPYYSPLSGIEISGSGQEITITWVGQTLRPGDEENEYSPLYLVEIWACKDGKLHFTPYGLFEEKLTVTNETGCQENAYGRLYFAEKHGYAKRIVLRTEISKISCKLAVENSIMPCNTLRKL